jgi:nuclear transport factor 2 (NTF2) superfamily protein
MEQKALIPPFTMETAAEKLSQIESAWNSCNPETVSQLYTADAEWRDRTDQAQGREEIKALLAREWEKELDFKVKKDLWGAKENRMAVRFEYDWRDHSGGRFHSYGVEVMEFDEAGFIRRRFASINDLPIFK